MGTKRYSLKVFNLLSINSCFPGNCLFHISKPYPFDTRDLKCGDRGISQTHSAHVGAGVWFYLKISCLLFRMNFDGKRTSQVPIVVRECTRESFPVSFKVRGNVEKGLGVFSLLPIICHSLTLLPYSLARQVFDQSDQEESGHYYRYGRF